MKWYWIVGIILVVGFGIYYLMAIKPYQDKVSACQSRGGTLIQNECRIPTEPGGNK